MAILQWLRRHEPDQRPEDAVQFEAEITSETTVDLILRIRLSERVIVNMDNEMQEMTATHTMPSPDEPHYAAPVLSTCKTAIIKSYWHIGTTAHGP